MRTKTLLLIAAFGAAGAATSMAQVFSVNAVGYVNKTVPANSYMMVSNPLKAATNTVNALFTGVPAGFQVYVYTPGKGYDTATFDDLEGGFVGTAANMEITPGEGVFVRNPTTAAVTVTFVGEVPQGTLVTPLVAGLQIVSSQVPQAGTPQQLGYVGEVGDQIYQFNATTQKYDVATFDDLVNDWDPAPKVVDVGDAFFLSKTKAGQWTRTFNVNQP
jgi:hypothetical protein